MKTLVLACAGASLPVLLIFSLGGTGFGDAITSEAIAEQVVATPVGSIALVAAVPITTARGGAPRDARPAGRARRRGGRTPAPSSDP